MTNAADARHAHAARPAPQRARHIRVLGGGPAGSAAAITALRQGASVELIEKSKLPRHKVCGEFISPGAGDVLRSLDVRDEFMACGPAPISRMLLAIGDCVKSCTLPEPAFGLSRYALDGLLFQKALGMGARVVRSCQTSQHIDVLAVGRNETAPRGKRLFGFKAHFSGEACDAVEVYFWRGAYVGVAQVEGGRTNVCGLAPEELLRSHSFDYDAVVAGNPVLSRRLQPLTRSMPWISCGPLVFRHRMASWPDRDVYPAGDVVSFVDPFTGSGIFAALLTGQLAGTAAVQRTPMDEYLMQCRRALSPAFGAASVFRTALKWGVAEPLARVVPASWMFRVTRPRSYFSAALTTR